MNEGAEIDRKYIEKAPSLLEIRCSRSKRWRLLEGACVITPDGWAARALKIEGAVATLIVPPILFMESAFANPTHHFIPVLSDPATLGCLLVLVREAYQCPWLSVVGSAEDGWRIDAEGSDADVSDLHSFGSEAEALVTALEVAE